MCNAVIIACFSAEKFEERFERGNEVALQWLMTCHWLDVKSGVQESTEEVALQNISVMGFHT